MISTHLVIQGLYTVLQISEQIRLARLRRTAVPTFLLAENTTLVLSREL